MQMRGKCQEYGCGRFCIHSFPDLSIVTKLWDTDYGNKQEPYMKISDNYGILTPINSTPGIRKQLHMFCFNKQQKMEP